MRSPISLRRICFLDDVAFRPVSVIYRPEVMELGGPVQHVLEFRVRSSRVVQRVRLAEIYRAKVGNVELSRALDGVDAAVDRVRDARQFHLYERTPDCLPKLDIDVLPFPVQAGGKVCA